MIDLNHPFFFLEPLFSKNGVVFHFSRYVYTPDSLLDEREIFAVSGNELTVDWLETSISELKPNQELAIQSDVTIDKRTFHIPMLDFATQQIGAREIDRIKAFLPRRVFGTSSFYHSGRSFHTYSTALLSPKDWVDFLGRALLINPKDGPAIVDSRWIGHRLIAGYCSLRFSNNSRQYLGMPRHIGIRTFLENKAARQIDSNDQITDR